MALKIKLSRIGTKHKPAFRIVIAEARSRRDGASVEQIGTYQPKVSDAPLRLDLARADYWLKNGAVPTDTVKALINKARRKAPPPAEPVPPAETVPAS
jgi:small subunit ribosomal protein S16